MGLVGDKEKVRGFYLFLEYLIGRPVMYSENSFSPKVNEEEEKKWYGLTV